MQKKDRNNNFLVCIGSKAAPSSGKGIDIKEIEISADEEEIDLHPLELSINSFPLYLNEFFPAHTNVCNCRTSGSRGVQKTNRFRFLGHKEFYFSF
jgi:hypothetical protein